MSGCRGENGAKVFVACVSGGGEWVVRMIWCTLMSSLGEYPNSKITVGEKISRRLERSLGHRGRTH